MRLRHGSDNPVEGWIGEYDEVPLICKPELLPTFPEIQTQILNGYYSRSYRFLYIGSTHKMSSVQRSVSAAVMKATSAADSVNFLLRAIAAIKGTSSLLHRDFVQVLIQYAKLKGKYPDFLILFKSSETSATTEKAGISVMKPPLNDYKSGSGHDSNCYIYYVFMHKDLQEFWSKKTKLVGRKRFRLLKTLENKY